MSFARTRQSNDNEVKAGQSDCWITHYHIREMHGSLERYVSDLCAHCDLSLGTFRQEEASLSLRSFLGIVVAVLVISH